MRLSEICFILYRNKLFLLRSFLCAPLFVAAFNRKWLEFLLIDVVIVVFVCVTIMWRIQLKLIILCSWKSIFFAGCSCCEESLMSAIMRGTTTHNSEDGENLTTDLLNNNTTQILQILNKTRTVPFIPLNNKYQYS